MMEFAVSDRVILAAEAEHGGDPTRIGVVIDTGAVDADFEPVILVDFPWHSQYVVVPPTALELVDRPADPEPPLALLEAAQRIRERGVTLITDDDVIDHLLTAPTPEEHPYQFSDKCSIAGCGLSHNDPIHKPNPPYRMRFIDDINEGDGLFLTGPAWVQCTVLVRRDAHDCAHLILVDQDGDQRGMQAPLMSIVPVPL